MPIDPSIALQARGVQLPDPLEAYGRGLNMQQALMQNQELKNQQAARARTLEQENAVNQAYKSAYSPDSGLDRQSLAAALAQSGYGSALPGIQEGFAKQDKAVADAEKAHFDKVKAQSQRMFDLANSVVDENSYQLAKQTAAREGVDISQMPINYNPAFIATAKKMALSAKDALDQEFKNRGYDLNVAQYMQTGQNQAQQREIDRARLGLQQQELGLKINPPQKKVAMPASLVKELIQTDEEKQANTMSRDLLNKAKELSATAYKGIGANISAKAVGNLGALIGIDTPEANATIELDNIMGQQVLESLRSSFGGAPTEGERKYLNELQAFSDKTPEQRKALIDKGISLAERRIKFADTKAKAIRKGSYTEEGFDPTATTEGPNLGGNAPAAPKANVIPKSHYDQLIAGAVQKGYTKEEAAKIIKDKGYTVQ